MKKSIFLLLEMFVLATACKSSNSSPTDESNTNETTELSIISSNEGKYPHDIHFFEDSKLSKRLSDLLGDSYQEVKNHFQTETPIVSENGIYKITGCKEHACPDFLTTIIYDSKKDNLYITIEQEGKDKMMFLEKEAISLTETLKAK